MNDYKNLCNGVIAKTLFEEAESCINKAQSVTSSSRFPWKAADRKKIQKVLKLLNDLETRIICMDL